MVISLPRMAWILELPNLVQPWVATLHEPGELPAPLHTPVSLSHGLHVRVAITILTTEQYTLELGNIQEVGIAAAACITSQVLPTMPLCLLDLPDDLGMEQVMKL